MNHARPRRLRSFAVTTALIAGFLSVSAAAAGSTAAPTPPATASAAAPEAAGSASGFELWIRSVPNPPGCNPPNFDSTTEPYFDRSHCAFVDFVASGVTGAMSAELYAEGASTPFATPAVTTPTAGEGHVSLTSGTAAPNDWSNEIGRASCRERV